jgi:hypothetical protein
MALAGVTNNRLAVALGSTQSQAEIQALLDFPVSAVSGLTAFATGGQTNATPLTAAINRVTTVGTAADSVKLPVATPGLAIVVINAAAANAMNLYPALGDSINALAANAAFSVVANKTVHAYCAVAGTWNLLLTA